ncbi:MAG TPA: hypothetical protein PKI81_06460 [bacterium]|nr:hypothetical protein [bacterium]
MKKICVLALLLMGMALMTGCTLSKDFIVTLEKEYTVNYNGTSYSKAELINATSFSDDLDKFEDDLKSVNVTKVTYLVTYFNGPASQQINSALLSVAPADGSSFTTLTSFANVNLASVAAKEQEVEVDEAGEEVVEDELLGADHSLQMKFAGTANQAPLNFKIKFKVTCKVKYEKKLI